MAMDRGFWDGARWHGHIAFKTVAHRHVSSYSPALGFDICDLMVVGCEDGRWYIEDEWGDHELDKVWNPFDPSDAGPHFFLSEEDAMKHAALIATQVSGVPVILGE